MTVSPIRAATPRRSLESPPSPRDDYIDPG